MQSRQTKLRLGGGKTRLAVAATIAAMMAVASAAPNVWFDPNDAQSIYTWRYNQNALTEQFDGWSKVTTTVTPDTDTAPDGTTSADTLVFANATSYVLQQIAGVYPVVPGDVVTMSVYAKSATRVVQFGGASPVGTDVYSTEALPNGWFRQILTRTFTANNSGAPMQYLLYSGAGFGAGSIAVWGAQFVKGSQARPYQRITDAGAADMMAAVPNYTLFQDNLGTMPVTAVEQTVGLILDKSMGAVRGPENFTNIGAPFTSTANWNTNGTLSIVNGRLRCTATATGNFRATITAGATANRAYEGRIRVAASTVATTIGGWQFSTASGVYATTPASTAARINSFIIAPATTPSYIGVSATAAAIGDYFEIELASAKDIRGAHALQATAAARPILSARQNQLLYSQDFSNAAGWAMTTLGTGVAPVVTPAYAAAPDGTNTASRVQFSTGAGVTTGDISQVTAFSQPTVVNGTYTSGIWLKSNTGANQTLHVTDITGATTSIVVTPTWQQFTLTRVATATASIPVRFRLTGNAATSADIQAWGAQFEPGSTLGKYQRITTATEYDAAGYPMYLRFDGTDDALQIPSLDLSTTDKLTTVLGLRTTTTTGTQMVIETGNAYTQSPGRFEVSLNEVAAGALVFARTASIGPVVNQYRSEVGQSAPRFAVFSVVSDFSAAAGTALTVRTNGQAATGSVSGTGTRSGYSLDALNIGSRNGTANFFNGNLYGLMLWSRGLRPDDLNMAERYMAQRVSGGTI